MLLQYVSVYLSQQYLGCSFRNLIALLTVKYPLVSCIKCRNIVGDTYSYVGSERLLNLMALSAICNGMSWYLILIFIVLHVQMLLILRIVFTIFFFSHTTLFFSFSSIQKSYLFLLFFFHLCFCFEFLSPPCSYILLHI